MPDDNPTLSPREEANAHEGTVLLLLIDSEEQRPGSVYEVVREIGNRNAIDSIASLHGAGLIHRLGDFVWASRAAIRGDQIAI
jgi:hypothetical protein